MKSIILYLIFFVSSVLVFCQTPQVAIEKIIKNPADYATKSVEIEGFIIQYVHAANPTNTSYYLIKDAYGYIIKVNTMDEAPEINKKYIVHGIAYVEKKIINRKGDTVDIPFLSEKDKSIIPPPVMPKTDYLLYSLIGGAGVLFIGGILFVYIRTKNKNKSQPSDWQAEQISTDYSQIPKMDVPPPYQPTIPDNDFKTIKINTTPNKTMRLIPGHLEIINGEDKGKAFLIQGYPTKEGSIITIGREIVTGEKSHSHIQIDSRYQTVSRKQAELIYIDKKLNVRNLSETNITVVDGHELKLGEVVELHPASIIKMGDLEFQYKV